MRSTIEMVDDTPSPVKLCKLQTMEPCLAFDTATPTASHVMVERTRKFNSQRTCHLCPLSYVRHRVKGNLRGGVKCKA